MVKIQVNSQGKAYLTTGGKALVAPEGGSSGKYQLLQRIKDDNNVEIGTVSGFFTDANNVEYAVVCLDAQYRLDLAQWCSTTQAVTNMPSYSNLATSNVWGAKETATENTQLILDYCTAKGYTSSACVHCRSKSFVINGVTYYGQFPNAIEVFEIAKNYNTIETMDTSASSNPSLNFSTSRPLWSSSQNSSNYGWELGTICSLTKFIKTNHSYVTPVLELPNQ